MDFFSRMKQKLGRFAVQNLSLYVTVVFAAGYLLLRTDYGNQVYSRYLAFYPYQVLHGQIWRILTAIFYPPSNTSNLLLGALSIFVYYNFASAVERTMGEFEYNLYFFGSILIGELGSILYYAVTGNNFPFLPVYTHFSVFMAFAIICPEASVLLFFVIPVKIKWVALVELAVYLFDLISAVFRKNLYTAISVLAALVPVFIFYLLIRKRNSGADIISRIRFRIRQRRRQKEWRDHWQ